MGKSRVSLTLDEDLLKRVDAEAEHLNLNRSQMVENIIEDYIKTRKLDTAVVLCGGSDPAALNDYNGRPAIQTILEGLEPEFERVILLAGDEEDEIRDKVKDQSFSFDLEYRSDGGEGPAKALKQLEDSVGKTFLVLNGNALLDIDFDDMMRVHREEDSKATMALSTAQNPSKFGVVKMKGRKILGFEEKPSPGEEPTKLVNVGAYIFEPEIFEKLEASMGEFFDKLSSEGQLSGYIYNGKWERV
jgi:NDP-sugar pyrophosphorylase family protein